MIRLRATEAVQQVERKVVAIEESETLKVQVDSKFSLPLSLSPSSHFTPLHFTTYKDAFIHDYSYGTHCPSYFSTRFRLHWYAPPLIEPSPDRTLLADSS